MWYSYCGFSVIILHVGLKFYYPVFILVCVLVIFCVVTVISYFVNSFKVVGISKPFTSTFCYTTIMYWRSYRCVFSQFGSQLLLHPFTFESNDHPMSYNVGETFSHIVREYFNLHVDDKLCRQDEIHIRFGTCVYKYRWKNLLSVWTFVHWRKVNPLLTCLAPYKCVTFIVLLFFLTWWLCVLWYLLQLLTTHNTSSFSVVLLTYDILK